MPRTSYEWDGIDAAAARRMDQIITDSGQNNSRISEHLDNRVSYSRIRDIRLGLKAPLRLSEFVGICRVCGVDPVEMLTEIIDDADRGHGTQPDDTMDDTRQSQIIEHLRAAIQLAEDTHAGSEEAKKKKALEHMQRGLDLAAYRSEHKGSYIDGDAA